MWYTEGLPPTVQFPGLIACVTMRKWEASPSLGLQSHGWHFRGGAPVLVWNGFECLSDKFTIKILHPISYMIWHEQKRNKKTFRIFELRRGRRPWNNDVNESAVLSPRRLRRTTRCDSTVAVALQMKEKDLFVVCRRHIPRKISKSPRQIEFVVYTSTCQI